MRPSDEQAIRRVLEEFLIPFDTGDVERLLAYYTDDAVWMLPNRWEDANKIAAREFYGAAFEYAKVHVEHNLSRRASDLRRLGICQIHCGGAHDSHGWKRLPAPRE